MTDKITDYDKRILTWLAHGHSIDEICHQLSKGRNGKVFEDTEKYIKGILPRKLNAKTVTQTVAHAVSMNLIQIEPPIEQKKSAPSIHYSESLFDLYELSPKNREILGLIAEGKSNNEIHETLGITRNTLRRYLRDLYRACGIEKKEGASKREQLEELAKRITPYITHQKPQPIVTQTRDGFDTNSFTLLSSKFGDSFGSALRFFRKRCSYQSESVTQAFFLECLSQETGIEYLEPSKISNLERDVASIHHDDRFTLIAIIAVLYRLGGLTNKHEANLILYIGNYRSLNKSEIEQIEPKWLERVTNGH